MPRVALREAVYATLASVVEAALTDATVRRNDPDPASSDAPLPSLNLMDGRHSVGETETAGEVLYTFEWLVEGWVRMDVEEDKPGLGARLNDLAARVSDAAVPLSPWGDPLPLIIDYEGGTLELWVEEPDFDLALFGVSSSSIPTCSFLQTYAVAVRWPRGRHFIYLP